MKRVLHIIQSLDTGGAERVVAEYALAHDRDRFEPEVCSVFGGGHLVQSLESADVPVHLLGRRWKIDPVAFLRLTWLIARRRFHVVHNHNFTALTLGLPAAVLGGARTIVRTEHNVTIRRRGPRTALSKLAALHEHAQIAVADAVRESHVAAGRVPPRRFVTVRNGISGERLTGSDRSVALREELGVPRDALVFLSIGSLTRQKNFGSLLDAAARVVREVPDARFVVAGDGPEREQLLEKRAELDLEEHVVFAGRRVDVPELLRSCDAFVLASSWEGLPITILEAMASGLPCVATRVGGVPEVLEDGVSGLVVPPRDAEALARALVELARDEGLRVRLAARAGEVYRTGYTAGSMARQTEALYDLASRRRTDLVSSGPMKVLYVIGQLSYGGAERQVVELATRLPRDRYEPVVCCLSQHGPLADEIEREGIRVVSIGKRPGVASGASRTLLNLMRSERPAVVHSYLFSASWRTLLVGRLAQVPLVITSVRNVDIHGGTRSHILLERALAPLNDLVIANAQAVKDHVTDVHRIASDKIRVIHNGVAVSRVKANETGAPHRGAPTVLIVASLTPKKDHATFLSAAALVHDRMPESRFIIVGDGPLKGELVRRSEELGLSGAIDFRGELEDVGAVLAEADVCALTSIKEGCSNFILESMLAGKPVVATDAGGNRELVVTGETGYIVRIGDASGVADRVCELLEDPKLARDMGERGRERVRSEFSIARMVEQTVDLYDRTLEERVEGLVEWSRARAARRTRNAPVDG